MATETDGRRIKSVDRAFELVEVLRDATEPLTLTELAEATDRAPSTLHAYLTTLADHGVVCELGGGYRLGLKFIALGEHVRHRLDVYQAGRDEVTTLARETGDSAHLIVKYDAQLLAIWEWFGDDAVGVAYHERKRERFLSHLHCTASGKALLAHLPEAEIEEVVERHGLAEMTPATITDHGRLYETLAAVRERGYAVSDEEQMQGLRAVGAPIRDRSGDPVGAVSVAAPTRRLQDEAFHETVPEQVMRTANVIEVNYRTLVDQSL
jgi:DNA-binding IclR family transcriptional regulator